MDGGEGPRRLDELDKLVVVADDPLRVMRAREGGPKSERLPVPVKIKDRGSCVGENKGGTRGGRRRGGPRREGRTPTDNGRALSDGKRLTR